MVDNGMRYIMDVSELIKNGRDYKRRCIKAEDTIIYGKDISVGDALAFLIGYTRDSKGIIDTNEFSKIMSFPRNKEKIAREVAEILINEGCKSVDNISPAPQKSEYNSIW